MLAPDFQESAEIGAKALLMFYQVRLASTCWNSFFESRKTILKFTRTDYFKIPLFCFEVY